MNELEILKRRGLTIHRGYVLAYECFLRGKLETCSDIMRKIEAFENLNDFKTFKNWLKFKINRLKHGNKIATMADGKRDQFERDFFLAIIYRNFDLCRFILRKKRGSFTLSNVV